MTGQSMSEDALLTNVLQLARLLRLRTVHQRPARVEDGWRTAVSGDGKGWPDLVIVGRALIVRELKSSAGKVRPEQVAWIAALQAAGVDVDVWRPEDWRSGRIERELKALAAVAVPMEGVRQ